ncbi:MAG: IS1595 family transposase [Acidobacteriia bacterium]|nr:IS1595 family transposase [Terriglobia bacterium]
MDGKNMKPKTLQDAILFFSNPDNALEYMKRLRFPDGVVYCPRCGREDVVFLKNQRKWQCKSVHPKRQFSAKVGTVMEDSPIPADKWLTAVWMLSNCKNGVSSYEIAKAIGVTQKSAWFMLHRIRLGLSLNAKKFGTKTKIGGGSGPVEVDETFVGGKLKNMHKDRRERFISEKGGRTGGSMGKTAVMGMLDRDLRTVRAKVIPNVKRETLQATLLSEVKHGTKVYTDEAVGYDKVNYNFVHDVVNHMETYVNGQVHTNGIENFWSLLKRTLKGTYVAVEPFHLERYVDEQVFRYNHRKHEDKTPMTDLQRFETALPMFVGKRLTFAEVTGKTEEEQVPF